MSQSIEEILIDIGKSRAFFLKRKQDLLQEQKAYADCVLSLRFIKGQLQYVEESLLSLIDEELHYICQLQD